MNQLQSKQTPDNTTTNDNRSEKIQVSNDVLQHYHNLEKIGHGAQATMLKALDAQDQPVAIKVFDYSTVREWKDVELFEREIDVLKNLHIDGVPRYIETIKTDKVIYLVEQYIDAQSLEKQMKNGRNFTIEECETILERTTAILTHLESHTPPIIHRDIKPANLLVDSHLNVWLVDFGVVMNTMQTFSMTFAGTAGYVAPEQLFGKTTPASDIFSLGATMLHLVSHTAPSDMELDGILPDFDRYIPQSVPQWLSDTIKQMMAANPKDRPKDGQKLSELIQANKQKKYLSKSSPASSSTSKADREYETGQRQTDLFQHSPYENARNDKPAETKQPETKPRHTKFKSYSELATEIDKLALKIKHNISLHPLNTVEETIEPSILVDYFKRYHFLIIVIMVLTFIIPIVVMFVGLSIANNNSDQTNAALLGMLSIFLIFIPLLLRKSKLDRYKVLFGFQETDSFEQSRAITMLLQDALTGNSESQYTLGHRYDCGFEVPKDKYLAIRWYQLAAEQENTARKRLAELYDELNITPRIE